MLIVIVIYICMMEKKNTLLVTVIAVATLLVAVVGATFAYFNATATGTNQSTVTVTTKSIDTVSTTASALTLDINLTDMLLANGKNDFTVSKSATSSLTLSAGTGNGGGTNTCSTVFRVEKIEGNCCTFRVLAENPDETSIYPYVTTNSFFTMDCDCLCAIKCLSDTYVDCVC